MTAVFHICDDDGVPPRHHRYRIEDGVHCVDVKINTIEQLFDNRDPAPFRERDLDPDLIEYLVAAAEDLAPLGEFKLVFWVATSCVPEEVETGFRAHFEYEIERLERTRRRNRRTGEIGALIGVTVLAALLSLAQLLGRSEHAWVGALREGLVLLSWVVMWRPVEALIYDWIPVRRERKVFEHLLEAPVDVRTGKGP